MLASPTNATTRFWRPRLLSPRASPIAVAIAVPACPTSNKSYGLSLVEGKPLIPFTWRSVLNSR